VSTRRRTRRRVVRSLCHLANAPTQPIRGSIARIAWRQGELSNYYQRCLLASPAFSNAAGPWHRQPASSSLPNLGSSLHVSMTLLLKPIVNHSHADFLCFFLSCMFLSVDYLISFVTTKCSFSLIASHWSIMNFRFQLYHLSWLLMLMHKLWNTLGLNWGGSRGTGQNVVPELILHFHF